MAYNPNVPAPDNLVQDDIAAMRENFQHLDPLAQVVDELQAVSELAQITDDLQIVSELAPIANALQAVSGLAPVVDDLQGVSALAPYVQALLDSRIVEMGSNSNGEYVRWENGLQVCYHMLNIGNPSGVQSFSWTYPAAFASRSAAYPMGIVATSGPESIVFGRYVKSAVMRYGEATATQTTFFVEFSSAPSTVIYIHAFAIGRWK